MRSCDSLIRISAGPRAGSRSGTVSRSTVMPLPPPAASSVVAHATPAAPRSWMPVTRPAAYRSRQHSISSFSMKGSPTWTLGRLAESPSTERGAGQHGRPADAVRAGPGAEQDHLVAGPPGRGELEVLVPHDPDAQRVDQRVPAVAGGEGQFAADVGQAQAVPVERDAGHHPGQHPPGVRRLRRARTAASPSPRPAGPPWPGCRARSRPPRSPRPGTARRTRDGCATRP